MAKDLDVNIGHVQGTGAAGRVTKDDVRKAVGPQSSPSVQASSPSVRSVPESVPTVARRPAGDRSETRSRMTKRRATIARRLVEAQHTAAMLTTFNEIDMTEVMALRERKKESFKKQWGVNLGFTSFFTKASIAALRAFPQLNAEIQGDEIVLKHYYDIGIAVGAEGGLVVPVLRDAEQMSFAEIELGVRDFAARAKEGALTLEDLKGGTFTITNGGVFGSLMSTPILNPPQVAILGLHKIEDRAVPRNGQVVIRPMMYVAVSYDHRIVDGREAVQFLVKIKECIEDPGNLLLES
jgi:2-oxoglutarate dehydrogenase E2 component (dihydrolipoamide succinyltransferase)